MYQTRWANSFTASSLSTPSLATTRMMAATLLKNFYLDVDDGSDNLRHDTALDGRGRSIASR